MNLTEIHNEAVFVKESVNLFSSNLLSAIVLVVVVVCIFMGLRSAFIVSVPIPLVICIVFGSMLLLGIPIHQVSIASMIISLSLLVPNGIVSNDNINVYLEKGEDINTACTEGVKEVKIPILTSTLTTIASFLPLAMMQGTAGKFAYALPVLVSVALIASYVVSLTLVPALAHILLAKKEVKNPEKNIISQRFAQISDSFLVFYNKVLLLSLKNPKKVLLITVVALAMCLLLIPSMQVQIFPPVEREQYILNIVAQDGSTVEVTDKLCQEIAQILSNESSVQNFAYSVGKGFMKYHVTFFLQIKLPIKLSFWLMV